MDLTKWPSFFNYTADQCGPPPERNSTTVRRQQQRSTEQQDRHQTAKSNSSNVFDLQQTYSLANAWSGKVMSLFSSNTPYDYSDRVTMTNVPRTVTLDAAENGLANLEVHSNAYYDDDDVQSLSSNEGMLYGDDDDDDEQDDFRDLFSNVQSAPSIFFTESMADNQLNIIEQSRSRDDGTKSMSIKISMHDLESLYDGKSDIASTKSKQSQTSRSTAKTPKSMYSSSTRSVYTTTILRRRKDLPQEPHIVWWGHSKRWTLLAVLACLCGSVLSIMARRSYEFVRLREPLYIAPTYYPLYSVGMLQLQLCYNTTMTGRTDCEDLQLTTDDVQDNMFELARICLSLAIIMGSFFSIFQLSAIFWESINLKPVGFGFLAAYFLQSFAMLFYDTKVCSSHKCRMGPGCLMSIGASLAWIVACMAVAKMDQFKVRARRERRRELRRKLRAARRAARKKSLMARESSMCTERTIATEESSGSTMMLAVEVDSSDKIEI